MGRMFWENAVEKPDEGSPPHSEPLVVNDVYVTGFDVEMISKETGDRDLRLVGWVDHGEERRITVRVVTQDSTARDLLKALKKALTTGSH